MTTDASLRQRTAANPGFSTWLSANAGSGKTRVLTDRVARLLLDEVQPQNILCLTYTKAAASEMQNRLFKRLGEWAMKPDEDLRSALADLGESPTVSAERLALARQLFARAIETPGGLRIQTIHSFCATILRRFPLEANVSPGFTELDDRAARLMRTEIVEEMAEGLAPQAIERLTEVWSGEELESLVSQIARERTSFAKPLTPAQCRALFGVPVTEDHGSILCDVFLGGESDWMETVIAAMTQGKQTDVKGAMALRAVDFASPTLESLIALEDIFLTGATAKVPFSAKLETLPTKDTRARLSNSLPRLHDLMNRVELARSRRIALQAAEKTEALHAFAAAYLPLYEARKAARGFLDFDDLISRASALLTDPSLAAWVLFRLDGGIDHILVDEAQDTSPEQWQVIQSLTEEFTAGQGAGARDRTIFVVGDKKQSIYSFQGADVAAFDRMRDHFQFRMDAAKLRFQSLSLEHSFRSSPAVLRVVDAAFPEPLWPALGGPVHHLAFRENLPGRVDLWPVIAKPEKQEDQVWFDPIDLPSEHDPSVVLANMIAQMIAQMIAEGVQIPVADGPDRPVHAGDFLILVQRRSGLFSEVIRACKAAGLPIAGADRLKLGAELAVKDLAALLSFLATPEDDLSLAALLRSPLCGWTEAQLFRLAHGRKGFLWTELRGAAETYPETLEVLNDLRSQADFLRPYDLIERALTRHDGRRKLLARLGPEAEDGIDEFLSQALAYERTQIPSLTGFLIWLETDDVEVKRQMDSEGHRIRVMTVHGAKGLEAPIVILPDTADRRPQDSDEIFRLPQKTAIWRTSKDESPPEVTTIRENREIQRAQENLRLLYVAMTRARTWLIVAAAGEVKKPDNWYNLIQTGLKSLGTTPVRDGIVRYSFGDWPLPAHPQEIAVPKIDLPVWVTKLPPAPERMVEPLSPSNLGGAKAVLGETETMSEDEAKERGRKLHLLLEHLPGFDPSDWERMANSLLGDQIQSVDLLAEAIGVLSEPSLAAVFQPGTLAEVGITADWRGYRVKGTIDRLVLTPERALIVDFKSNRVIPETQAEVPLGYLRQMGAYAHAISQIYPEREVQTAILWTRAPRLMQLDPDIVRDALANTTMA